MIKILVGVAIGYFLATTAIRIRVPTEVPTCYLGGSSWNIPQRPNPGHPRHFPSTFPRPKAKRGLSHSQRQAVARLDAREKCSSQQPCL